jgi:hypothetical protein
VFASVACLSVFSKCDHDHHLRIICHDRSAAATGQWAAVMPSCRIAEKSSIADEFIRFGQNFVSVSREGGHGSVVSCQRGESATAECSLRGERGSDYYLSSS